MLIKIITDTTSHPPGKVADAELHFDETDSPILAGMKLIGFGVWERTGQRGYNVTFPARQYQINGERRSFALLRPTGLDSLTQTQERLKNAIVDAYRQTIDPPATVPSPLESSPDAAAEHDIDARMAERAASNSTTTTTGSDDLAF